ncbi:MAG: LysR family transcriptional regulator [Chthoniobacter sp.]
MELRHLRYFVAAAEEENVTRAAAKLHVAQPAVSRQIHDLEDELGLPLLERTAKSVRLTDAGRVFLAEARAVLQRADDAIKTVRAVAGGRAANCTWAMRLRSPCRFFPARCGVFQAAMPGVRVSLHDLSTEEMLGWAARGSAACVSRHRPRGRANARPAVSRIGAVSDGRGRGAGPSLRASTDDHAGKSGGRTFIGYSREGYPEYHVAMGKVFASTGRVPHIVEEHDSVTSLIAAVEAGRGIAWCRNAWRAWPGPG